MKEKNITMESFENNNESETMLTDKRIAIINSWENKFTDLYVSYFQQNNDVQLIKPQSQKQLLHVLKKR